jgi:uncharacterized protein involved in response to NO
MRELVVVVFVNSLTPPPPPNTSPLQNLFAQPHRVFFFFGVLFGVIFIALLALSYLGLISLHVSTNLYHAYTFVFVVFTQFFAGFLLTVFPRYLSRPAVAKKEYLLAVYLINAGGLCFVLSSLFLELGIVLSMLAICLGYIKLFMILLGLQLESKVTNKQDTTWILISFAFGLAGQMLFIIDILKPMYVLAYGVSFYLYLFFVVLVISQKMVPFFTANNITGYSIDKSKYLLHVIFFALILKVALEFFGLNQVIADVILFATLTRELIKWKLPFAKAPAILWVLFLALWWMPIGFALFVLQDMFDAFEVSIYLEKAPLHAISLGYFTTMLIGFGTRIILGHSGRAPKADRYAVVLFSMIQIMTLMRVIAGIFPNMGYTHALLTSAALWIVVFALWSKRYLPILFEK